MSLCQFWKEGGGTVGEVETADGKKLNMTNDTKP
jgi:hypothetical protein